MECFDRRIMLRAHRKRNRRRSGCLPAVLIVSVMAAGCSLGQKAEKFSDEIKEELVVGVVTKSSTSEYWMSVNSGMEAAAAKNHMEIIFMAPDSEQDRDVQEKQVEKLVEQQVDALAISPIDSYYVPEYMELIQEKNIPVVSFDTGFEECELPYIGIDNYKIGYELGKELARQLDHQGQVGIVSGDLNQMGHRERARGFQDYIESEPQMTIGFVESGYANMQMSEQKVRMLMQGYPQVKGIMATSAVTALGLADEMKDSGIKIVAVDQQEDSMEALEKGEICALAAQSGYDIGYQTIECIVKMCRGEEVKMENHLDAQILTQDNLQAYREAKKDEDQKH